jgi:hypothetical protein
MAQTTATASWHTLYFHIDEEGDAVLTSWSYGSKYHVIASREHLGKDTVAAQEFGRMVEAIQIPRKDNKDTQRASEDRSADSGVDVRSHRSKSNASDDNEAQQSDSDEDALQRWMMVPLIDHLEQQANEDKVCTVEEWYHGPLHFYQLQPSNDGSTVEAVEAESSPDLDKWMEDLLPKVTIPKYITNKLDVSWFKGSELDVLDSTDKPVGCPYHPCKVRHRKSKKTYFLKIVDNDQPQPVKRELDILHRIRSAKLHEQFNVPLLQGLVTFDDVAPTSTGQKRIMGMLLTEIEEATPLTMKLDKDVPQEKRERWAREAERIKDILHEHEIIWGDAKADNFMVDKNDKLWIIDFGGSYTEGWVDPEFNETVEGDNMGTLKIVNALQDPVANVQHEEDEEEEEEDNAADGDNDDDNNNNNNNNEHVESPQEDNRDKIEEQRPSENDRKRKRGDATGQTDSPRKASRVDQTS